MFDGAKRSWLIPIDVIASWQTLHTPVFAQKQPSLTVQGGFLTEDMLQQFSPLAKILANEHTQTGTCEE